MYSPDYVWAKVVGYMEDRLTAPLVSTWLDDASIVELTDRRLVLHSPTAFRKKMMGEKLINVGNAREALDNFNSYYREDGRGQIQQGTERTNQILAELQKLDNGEHSDIYSAYDPTSDTWVDNKEKALQDLKESYSQLMKDLEAVEDMVKQADDAFLASIDKVSEAYELQHKTLQFFGNQIL